MPDKFSLYYSKYCYFCQKVLMVLGDRQHQIELRNVSSGDHRSDLITGGGKAQVPCLLIESVTGQKQWLYESDDIINYIRHHSLVA